MNANPPIPFPASDNARWQSYFRNTLPCQIDRLIGMVERNKKSPNSLSRHFDSMLALFEQGISHPDIEIRLKLIELIRILHPFPVWWGKWSEWMGAMERATLVAQVEKQINDQIWLQLQQAKMFLTTGHGEKALVLSKKTYQMAREESQDEMILRAEMLIFEAEKYLGHIQNPLNDLEKLDRSFLKAKHNLHTKVFNELDIHFSIKKSSILQSQGHLKKALVQSQHAYRLSKMVFNEKDFVMAQVHNRLGGSYWAKNDHNKSIEHLEEAKKIYQQLGDRTSQIDTMGDIGLVYWSTAEYKKAEEILKQSISMAEELNLWRWQTIQAGDLGLVYFSQGKLSKALVLMNQHYKLAIKTNNHSETERASSNRANIHLYQGNFAEAYPRFLRSLRSVEDKNLRIAIGIVRAKIAWALEGLGHQDDALRYAKSALEHAETTEAPTLIILALRAISETENNPEKTIFYAQKALEMAKEYRRPLNEAGALFTLAEVKQDDTLGEKAIQILEKLGATAWLKAPVAFRTLRLPLLL